MIRGVAALLLAVPLAVACVAPSHSATLVISENALQKLLDSRYPSGKIPIGPQDECNNLYIESVRLTIDQGRVRVAGHLSGKLGTKTPFGCAQVGDPSNFTLSGKPDVSGSVVKLTNIQLAFEKAELQLITDLLLNFVRDTQQIDLKSAAEGALKSTAPYQIMLDNLRLQPITVQDKTLTIDFDFKLSIQ